MVLGREVLIDHVGLKKLAAHFHTLDGLGARTVGIMVVLLALFFSSHELRVCLKMKVCAVVDYDMTWKKAHLKKPT